MRVKELIDELKKLPPNMQVMVNGDLLYHEPAALDVVDDHNHGKVALIFRGPSNSDI